MFRSRWHLSVFWLTCLGIVQPGCAGIIGIEDLPPLGDSGSIDAPAQNWDAAPPMDGEPPPIPQDVVHVPESARLGSNRVVTWNDDVEIDTSDLTISGTGVVDMQDLVFASWPQEPSGPELALLYRGNWTVAEGIESGHEESPPWSYHSLVDCAFTPDGRRIAGVDPGNTLWLWETENNQVIKRFEHYVAWTKGFAFNPDGRRLVSAGDGLKMWDAETGEAISDIGDYFPKACVNGFSPDGRRFPVIEPGRRPQDVGRGDRPGDPGVQGPRSEHRRLRLHPGRAGIVSVILNGTLELLDAGSGQEISSLLGYFADLTAFAFSRD